MVKMLWYQLVVSIITIIGMLIWGEPAIKLLVLIAVSPFIYYYKWKKPDEREKLNFYKGTQFIVTIISTLILVGVFIFGIRLSQVVNIGNLLLINIVAGFIILNSVIRLYFHYRH